MNKETIHHVGDTYVVTGITTRGKRFTIHTDNPFYALAINLYKGNVWQVSSKTGKRTRIKSVNN